MNTDRTQDSLKKGGKELSLSESRNKEFDIPGNNKEFSRTQYFLLDKGTAPTGNADQQIEKSGEENFEYGQIANQSMMRIQSTVCHESKHHHRWKFFLTCR